MSLATRCTACGIVFRVVQDQLKVSEGWVRCGRCKEVFNALEGLFDLEREAPPQWRASPDAPVLREPASTSAAPLLTSETLEDARQAPDNASTPEALDGEVLDSTGFADARFDSEMSLDSALPPEADAIGSAVQAPSARAPSPDPVDEEPSASFLLAPERRPPHPLATPLLLVLALLLAGALAAQFAFHFRDTLAAQAPALRPLLATACEALGCALHPPRRIDDIAVESSSLVRASPSGDALKLVVALANRGPLPLAMPSVDLSLTDGNGALVARRALFPAEFRDAASTLAPHAEATLQVLLANPGGRVAGYTVAVFYP